MIIQKYTGTENSERVVRALFSAAIVCAVFLIHAASLSAQQKTEEKYAAELKPMNQQVAGNAASGKAEFRIKDDTIVISITAKGLTPSIMHLQHYHGFTEGKDAVCPAKEQDVNKDGVIDLIETEKTSGVTLVPFHDNPANLTIKTDTYPVAGSDGTVQYQQTVSLARLRVAVKQKYGMSDVQLEKMVVFLHGVDPKTSLPASLRSLPDVPGHVTLPVACGEIKKMK